MSLALNPNDFSSETQNSSPGADALLPMAFADFRLDFRQNFCNSYETIKAGMVRETLHRAPSATHFAQLKMLSSPGLMKTTYMFGVIKTDRRPFSVTRVV